ncbi:hypothetical protein HYPSUDRAFT_133739 [Hypholoma sublateritium FD-334 SS-4]|uniref:Uncharacterized protein n=1 Tax=Hypholoma sublateritium (strain FD-334 SS-4) TaxID=945553 RepID=A0A0D2LEM8_HYPSF|nr:hypothetical protein HYPSUDRAFT_133739 [Hypholoma sublateritium FD-334 SS-4]
MTVPVTRPVVSSPLAGSAQNIPHITRPTTKRNPSFPSSRPLRPFPTISHIINPVSAKSSPGAKPVKIIEPPKNFKATFVLDLTQAEFGRQD